NHKDGSAAGREGQGWHAVAPWNAEVCQGRAGGRGAPASMNAPAACGTRLRPGEEAGRHSVRPAEARELECKQRRNIVRGSGADGCAGRRVPAATGARPGLTPGRAARLRRVGQLRTAGRPQGPAPTAVDTPGPHT